MNDAGSSRGKNATERERIAAKVAKYPADLRPNPDYQYELPREVVVNGIPCIEVDAGMISWMAGYPSRSKGRGKNGT